MITTHLHPALNSPIDDNVDGIQVNRNKLLADLVESNFPLIAIARDHDLHLAQLIAWAAQPGVRALLDAADELANRVAAHKAAQGRTAAVQTLIGHASGLCESARDRDLASLAARTLVRITNPPKPASPRRKSAPPDAPGSDAPTDRALIRRTPHPEPIDTEETPQIAPPAARDHSINPKPPHTQPRTDHPNGHANGHPNGVSDSDAQPP